MSDPKTRNAAIAAACIMLGFGFAAFYMPNMMLALGAHSPALAGIFAAVFVFGFFFVFWLRGRSQRRKD
ncbi:hypothetical protein HB779_20180 [Phyllobacterium sp. 628]|uniref:hypothetical protein n=1 Tax=Phyllobacterium sp. 628 TaxID=2718938 RepID=UPI0016622088|nr:hypothetical protein [Phyllobacterium sp. 628]QND50702.1 hypothetical protein HB779_20180 [Phyllobacterium sp. 628]